MKLSDLDLLIPQPDPGPDITARWGVVTALTPLRVRLDGDDTALPVTPATLVYGLTIGARVWTLLAGRQLVIVGAYNGVEFPAMPAIPQPDQVTRLARTSDFDTGADVFTVVPWQVEIFDDAGAWTSAAPTLVTTPAGYSRACATFYTAWTTSTTKIGRFTQIQQNSNTLVVSNRNQLFESCESITTGWVPTTPGDKFRALANSHGSGADLMGSGSWGGPTWFEVRFR